MAIGYVLGYSDRKGGAWLNMLEDKHGIPIVFKSISEVKQFYAKFYKLHPRTDLEVMKGKIDIETDSVEDTEYVGMLSGGKYYRA